MILEFVFVDFLIGFKKKITFSVWLETVCVKETPPPSVAHGRTFKVL